MYLVLTLFLGALLQPSLCDQPYYQTIKNGLEVARLGHACETDFGCEFEYSECVLGKCSCVGGFEQSLYHTDDTCVPDTLHLVKDYKFRNLHWTDKLKNKESEEYDALVNRLMDDVKLNTGFLFVDVPQASFSPSNDGKVSANVEFNIKNPMVVKKQRTTREIHEELYRETRQLSSFLDTIKANIIAAAAAAGKTVTITSLSVVQGPLGKFCDGDCGIANAACVSSTCTCNKPDYVQVANIDDTCYPDVDLKAACEHDEQCGTNEECDTNCECVDGAVEITQGTECGLTTGIDGLCTDDAQCTVPGTKCYGTCICVTGVKNGDKCEGVVTTTPAPPPSTCPPSVLDGACTVECPCTLAATFCSDDSVCVCPTSAIGSDCSATCTCSVGHTTCSPEGQCQCENTYVEHDSACYERKNLQDSCEVSPQCPPNSECDGSNECQCLSTAVFLTGVGCLLKVALDEECEYDSQCGDNANCDTDACKCDTDFSVSYNVNTTGECVPILLTIILAFDYGTWTSDLTDTSSTAYTNHKAIIDGAVLSDNPTATDITLEVAESTDAAGQIANTVSFTLTNPDTVPPSGRVRRGIQQPRNAEEVKDSFIRYARENNMAIGRVSAWEK